MLKIKEDKMKDLEKLGFNKNEDGLWLEKQLDNVFKITVVLNTRCITIDCISNDDIEWTDELDILYNLIKADMVEKVVEDENHNN